MPEISEFDVRIFPDPVEYSDIHRLQTDINSEVRAGHSKETILLLQHKPVFTLGVHGDAANLLVPESDLLTKGVDIFRIERGGDITFHGPGQLVVYPIINLAERNYGVKEYVRRLEESVILTCGELGIKAGRREGAPGVWCRTACGESKICAVGIKVKKGITMHGLALNVNTDLSWFTLINPCGFQSSAVTSVEKLTGDGQVPSISRVSEILLNHLITLL